MDDKLRSEVRRVVGDVAVAKLAELTHALHLPPDVRSARWAAGGLEDLEHALRCLEIVDCYGQAQEIARVTANALNCDESRSHEYNGPSAEDIGDAVAQRISEMNR